MSQPEGQTLAKVLLVEDNEADIILTREMLKHERVRISLDAVQDGDEALDYLRRAGSYRDAAHPDLILLDLHLPRVDGHAVIREIRKDPALASIPVAILSGSETDKNRSIAQELGVEAYIVKPVRYENLAATVEKLPGLRFETDGEVWCLCVDRAS